MIAAALVSVSASHSTAGGCDHPVLGWKQRACLNMGLPEIQCSIQVLCAASCAGSILPKQKLCSLLLLPQVGLTFHPLVQASSWQHPPHFGPIPAPHLRLQGNLLRVLGLCKSMQGLLGAGSSWGGYMFWQRDQEVCSSG